LRKTYVDILKRTRGKFLTDFPATSAAKRYVERSDEVDARRLLNHDKYRVMAQHGSQQPPREKAHVMALPATNSTVKF